MTPRSLDALVDALIDAVVALRARPGRSALSAVGIGLAVAMFLLVIGIPAAGRAALDQRLTALGADVLVAQAAGATSDPVRLPADSVAMVRRIGPVMTAASVINLNLPVLRTRFSDPSTSAGIAALAIDGDLLAATHGRIISGTGLTSASAALSGVVLGRMAAGWLGITRVDAAHPVQILIGGRSFTVTGVLASMPLTPELEQAVLIGRASARTQLGAGGAPTVVYLRAAEAQLAAVQSVLPRTLAPQSPALVSVKRPSDALVAKQAAAGTLSALVLGVAAVALLIGGVGVSNTMVVAVLERRREIGVRRALGASRRDVATQFVVEAVLIAAIGAVAGTAIGLAGTAGWAVLHGWPLVEPLLGTAAAVVGALLTGAVAGLSPAVRAARVAPTEALAAP